MRSTHGLVFGWDSTAGRLLVRRDREGWEERSRLALFAFAVSPDDPDLLVATTPDGLIRSLDGCRTWALQPAPPLVLLA